MNDLLYRRARPEDAARLEAEQRQRCSQCTEKCQKPLRNCAGRATWREIARACAPTVSVMAACGGIAYFATLLFKAGQ